MVDGDDDRRRLGKSLWDVRVHRQLGGPSIEVVDLLQTLAIGHDGESRESCDELHFDLVKMLVGA